jgi:hypothetical protein
MRRVPSRLLFAAFTLSLTSLGPTGAFAEPGFRHGSGAHVRAFGRHGGFKGWSGPRRYSHHGFARSGPAFGAYGHHARRFGFHGGFFHGYGRSIHANRFYAPYGYGRAFFGHHGYGHGVYGRQAFGRLGYGHHGYGRIGYGHHDYGTRFYGHHGYGGHFYGRSGYGSYGHGPYGYGRRGYGFFPHTSWVWPSYAAPAIALGTATAPPDPMLAGIPSVADLPVSLGIRSAPVAAPAIYRVGSGTGSLRSGGIKVVSAERGSEGDADGSGPRIIRLDAPRGR